MDDGGAVRRSTTINLVMTHKFGPDPLVVRFESDGIVIKFDELTRILRALVATGAAAHGVSIGIGETLGQAAGAVAEKAVL